MRITEKGKGLGSFLLSVVFGMFTTRRTPAAVS